MEFIGLCNSGNIRLDLPDSVVENPDILLIGKFGNISSQAFLVNEDKSMRIDILDANEYIVRIEKDVENRIDLYHYKISYDNQGYARIFRLRRDFIGETDVVDHIPIVDVDRNMKNYEEWWKVVYL